MSDSSDLHRTLAEAVSAIIPASTLQRQTLRDVPEISLYLIDQSYPQHALNDAAIENIMNQPPYWVFCWASGQVLARYLLDHPEIVCGKRVLDFGAGSGVVAIAAALAGASEVIACDTDPLALAACQLNASINGVSLTVLDDFHHVTHYLDLILVADVLYDRDNLPWMAVFGSRADRVIVADSRVKDFAMVPYAALGRFESDTVPDLDESASFREVTLYST
jgi:predicted nicotinamide N-methyase